MSMDNVGLMAALAKAMAKAPTSEQVATAVTDWLDDHPEATTTVEDGAITNAKLASSFVTPGTAAAYSSSATYSVGDYCFYNGTLKRCIVPITTAESYTAAHWASAVIGDEVVMLRNAFDPDNAVNLLSLVPMRKGISNGVTYCWDGAKMTMSGTSGSGGSGCFIWVSTTPYLPQGMAPGDVLDVRLAGVTSTIRFNMAFYNANDELTGDDLYSTVSYKTTVPSDATHAKIRLLINSNTATNTTVYIKILKAQTNKELGNRLSSLASNTDKIAVQSYSDITVSSKRWDEKMELGDSSVLGHTQNYKIIPGADYYVGTISYVNNGVMGCFLDFNELPLKPLLASDCSEVSYPYPTDNPNTDFTLFTKLYKFTAPANAHYLSLNFILTASEHWRFFLSNIPMFREGNSGDLVVYENSHMRHKKSKKLCVVGPSYAMKDRRIESAYGNKYIVGFQEYLLPFYDSITTFGYSGGTWGQMRDDTYISIYSGIVTGYGASVLPKDFTPYDEVLLIGCNPNGFFSTPRQEEGTAGTYASNTSPVSSFMGGMRGVVEYILNQKPEMKIYLSNFWHTNGNNTSAFRDTCDNLNAEMLKLANLFGLQYIDMYNGTPFNKWNYTSSNLQYAYDGAHPNNAGMREIADVLVRAMI